MARILFTSTLGNSAWAGSEILWFQAGEILASKGNEVAAVLPPQMHVPKTQKRLSEAGIKSLSSPLDRWRFIQARLGRRLKPGRASAFAPIVRWAKRWQADIVVLSQASCWGAYTEMLALADQGIPYIAISQLNTPFSWPGDYLFEVVGGAFRKGLASVFVSQGNLDLLEAQIAQKLENAHVIFNPPSFDVSVACGPPPTDVFRLLNVARIDPGQKGQDLLVQVLALPKWRTRFVELEIAGGGDRQWLERLVGLKNLKNVRILGHISELRDAWGRASFGVFPSRYEGIPLALIEGMSLGRAIVATDVAGHREWVTDGENGFIASGCTAASLDLALESAYSLRGCAARLGDNARKTAMEKLSKPPAEVLADLILLKI